MVARTIGVNESTSDMSDEAQRTVRITEGTVCIFGLLRMLVGTDLATNPASAQATVVNAIERHAVAVSTERNAALVIAARLAGILIVVAFVVANGDQGDDAVIVEWVETALEASGSVGNVLTDVQVGQALAKMGKIAGHNGSFIGVCRLC